MSSKRFQAALLLMLGACGPQSVDSVSELDEVTGLPLNGVVPPTPNDVIQGADTIVPLTGKAIVKMLKTSGEVPATALVVFEGDRQPSDANDMRISANTTYISALSAHRVAFSNGTINSIKAGRLTHASVALMLCHELGHRFANRSEIKAGDTAWSEGEADFFATSRCLPAALAAGLVGADVAPADEESALVLGMKQRGVVTALSAEAKASIRAGRQLLNLVGSQAFVLSEVESRERATPLMSGEYPSDQCRLDTYFAGAAGKSRPTCWSPAKCSSAPSALSPYVYRLTSDNRMVVRNGPRVVAELLANPRNGAAAVLNGQPVKMYYDARSGTGNGLFVYTSEGVSFLAHDGVNKRIPIACTPALP
jgi:hypothetical protein